MGLLYLFPVSLEEQTQIDLKKDQSGKTFQICLKTYGLPLIFWFYLLIILLVILLMFLAIQSPLEKLTQIKDPYNLALGYSVYASFVLIPLSFISLFFYEKNLIKENLKLIIRHKIFKITFFQTTLNLDKERPFSIQHFMESPNMARIQRDPNFHLYQNKGYFELIAHSSSGKKITIDRHSRKSDLEKIIDLLCSNS